MFQKDFKRKMFLFDKLIASVLLYGAEVYGWKEWPEIKAIQARCGMVPRAGKKYVKLHSS